MKEGKWWLFRWGRETWGLMTRRGIQTTKYGYQFNGPPMRWRFCGLGHGRWFFGLMRRTGV